MPATARASAAASKPCGSVEADKMNGFIVTDTGVHRHAGALCCDGVRLAAIADAENTPVYV